jgi:type II secretory pathway pseudopilin PulG
MFLKKKKLSGMSLVELLAYTVILSIVTTALFQLIHFIQKMNDDLIREQEIYSEFNIALLKLDTFVSNSLQNSTIQIEAGGSCIKKTYTNTSEIESFYFTNDGALCSIKNECPAPAERGGCSNLITKPIFSTHGNYFFAEDLNNTKKIIFDFYVPNSILSTSGIASYIE